MNQVLGHVLALLVLTCLLATLPRRSNAQVYVHPYAQSDGTQVWGHVRGAADGTPNDNYSHPGNVNLYTGNVAPGNPDTYLRNSAGGGQMGREPFHTWNGLQTR